VDRCCVDVTVVSPLSETKAKHPEGRVGGQLAATRARHKVGKHQVDCVRNGMEFLPFSVDVCGMIDSAAWQFIDRLAESYFFTPKSPLQRCGFTT
jgi:hypothetical protein